MKKTLEEEKERFLQIVEATNMAYGFKPNENDVTEQIDSEDDEFDSMGKSVSNYMKDNPFNKVEPKAENRPDLNSFGGDRNSSLKPDGSKNPIWVDISKFIEDCKKEGMDNSSIKNEIMKYVETLLPNDSETDIQQETDEYEKQYDKNMSQGFSPLNEGNAFVSAAKKAKEQGKDTFSLHGKTYKVTVTASKKEEKGATNMAMGFGEKKENKK